MRASRRLWRQSVADALQPYASHPHSSRGRVHAEPGPASRSAFHRDRDRIIHSTAFRRLMYKTQVFVNHEGDHFRTRLTHSIEVAQIARTVAVALGLHEALTEAICLAHDLGHTPFGHAGQDALNACMRDWGGFEHNLQSLRIVDTLEEKYAEFDGLNLTFETREGILKHCSKTNAKRLGDVGRRFLARTLPGGEAQLADIADAMAYNNHDVDDGLRAGLLDIDALRTETLFDVPYREVTKKYPKLARNRLIHEVKRRMIAMVVRDLTQHSKALIAAAAPKDSDALRQHGSALIRLSDEVFEAHASLKKFLYANLYHHPSVKKVQERSRQIVQDLFCALDQRYELIPEAHRARRTPDGPQDEMQRKRVIADYLAGMTDRFAINMHTELMDQGVIVSPSQVN
ncbi:MAG: deoxyguanosinetriphosphate triphosphohydrolase [Pseudomonadota bacterium]